jgi:hypothetical protein
MDRDSSDSIPSDWMAAQKDASVGQADKVDAAEFDSADGRELIGQ